MSLLSRLKGLLKIHRLERDVEDELRAPLEMRAQDNLAAGMSPEKARYDARPASRSWQFSRWLWGSAPTSPFSLLSTPCFSSRFLFRILSSSCACMTTCGRRTRTTLRCPSRSFGICATSPACSRMCATLPADANITGGDHPERVEAFITNANYFTMLGVHAELGRTYVPADALPGFSEPVVISDAYWRRAFGADPKVLGTKIRLDGDLYSVAGVMPPSFHHPGPTLTTEVDAWLTGGFAAAPFPLPVLRAIRYFPVMGRLKPGLSVAQAQAQLDNFVAQLTRQFPDEYPAASGWSIRLVPTQEDIVGNVRTELFVLFAAVGFVLLIVCVNLANLLLARSASRQREMAIRLAIGADRGRLIVQLLTESLLLVAISGAAAILTVFTLKNSLLRLAPADLPRLNDVSLSPGVLLFAFFISILTGLLFGLAPALQTARADQTTALREGSRGAGSSKHQLRFSRFLVASEIALSLVLLIGAGLLFRSFWQLLEVRPGFDPHHVTTAKIWLATPNDPQNDPYFTIEKRAAFHQEILRRISALPGVEQAAIGSPPSAPMDGKPRQSPFLIEGRASNLEHIPVAETASVTPAYFSVLATALIADRFFTDADNAKGQQVVLIDETLAHRYWPNSDSEALGQRLQIAAGRRSEMAASPLFTIVGVVGNIKSDGFDAASPPHIYRAVYQLPPYGAVVYLRTTADPGLLGEAVRGEVQHVDPSIPVFDVRTMDFIVSAFLAERRFALELLGIFAGVALLLASIGIYGVMSYTFSQRTNEIGIRIAMGAQRSDILRLAVGEGTVTVALGVVAGLAGAAVMTRFLQSMLFDVKATDPLTYGAIAGLLTAVTLLACLVPAHRATRVDPLIALRHE